MNRIIIACATLRRELVDVMEASNCYDPVIWLEAGGHNVPGKRRRQLEAALAQCSGYDTVLLAMTFCGNALLGMSSGNHTLVLPRFDDCIPLLLGKDKGDGGSYYLSSGWLEGKDNLLKEYKRTAEKYGAQRADRIFFSMLRNYCRLVWLADDRSPAPPDAVKCFAEHFGLSLISQRKDHALLMKLINGDWDQDFRIVSPGNAITLEMRYGGENHA